jgi:hypothetical protein
VSILRKSVTWTDSPMYLNEDFMLTALWSKVFGEKDSVSLSCNNFTVYLSGVRRSAAVVILPSFFGDKTDRWIQWKTVRVLILPLKSAIIIWFSSYYFILLH